MKRSGEQTVFVWDGGESRTATGKNDDRTMSLINADPPLRGFEFVKSEDVPDLLATASHVRIPGNSRLSV